MKNKVLWMVMLMAVLSVVSSNARAVWDPNGDLLLNLDFVIHSNPNHDTNDAERGFVKGELFDYNTSPNCYDVFETNGKIGVDANFAQRFDDANDSEGDCVIICPNALNIDGALITPDPCLVTLGDPSLKRTWALWVYYPNSTSIDGTLIRHQNWDTVSYDHAWWEIRISSNRLQFWQNNNHLDEGSSIKMQTVASTIEYLSLNKWHHIAMVIDRNAATGPESNCKIYVDGLTQPVTFSNYDNTRDASIDIGDYYAADSSPLRIGKGSTEFDGRLDEIRLYSKALSAVEVSQLYQKQNAPGNPIALLPIPGSSGVPVTTDLTWIKVPGNGGQNIYFSNVFADVNTNQPGAQVGSGAALEIIDNSVLNGGNDLIPATTYYWMVRTKVGAFYGNGPVWSFKTEAAEASDPTPADGADHVEGTWKIADVNLSWTGPSTAIDYSVYFSTDKSLIDNNDLSARKNVGLAVAEANVKTPDRNIECYWRVDSNLATGMVTGPTWTFRSRPYEIAFSTADHPIAFQDEIFSAYNVKVHGNGWFALRADGNSTDQPDESDVIGQVATDGTVIFDFNTFDFDRRFEIVVIPQYRSTDANSDAAPIGIHVNGGDFYFDGTMNISGQDVLSSSEQDSEACSGGFAGMKANQSESIFPNRKPTVADYWTRFTYAIGNVTRFGTYNSESDHYVYFPTELAKTIFGPGVPVNPPYKGGGGGGYGGAGGDASRGYYFGVYSGGPSYGAKEVPVPFGGSAGGWGGGGAPGSGAGGGGVEIVADGNVVLDINSVITTNGGSQTYAGAYAYGAGGGAGGSVKIIGKNVTVEGDIHANGGKGANASSDNDCGGGGGGGRVAIFAESGLTVNGTITVDSGARGTTATGTGIAQNGEDGTIFITTNSPKKASAPTPSDSNELVYAGTSGISRYLYWYSGYDVTTDEVYCGTDNPPTTKIGSSVSATRGQHRSTETVSILPNETYYMQVKTDGTVYSDVWSFNTVGWECVYTDNATPHIKGPAWDTNNDCVLNFKDFWYFAKDWRSDDFGDRKLDGADRNRWIDEWLECYGRTNDDCENNW